MEGEDAQRSPPTLSDKLNPITPATTSRDAPHLHNHIHGVTLFVFYIKISLLLQAVSCYFVTYL